MSETIELAEATEVGKPRRAHRRMRPIADDAPVAEVAAELPPPATMVSLANARRGGHRTRLVADLEAAQRFNVPLNTSGDHRELARQGQVRLAVIADAERRLAEVDALDGWTLVRAYKANETGIWRG
jgi:hypothetical protein